MPVKASLPIVFLITAAATSTLAAGQAVGPADSDGSGAQGAPPPLRDILESMQREMDSLRKDNQAMKGQIDDLKAKQEADWLTEARATEIKGLVADVLADADTRASLLQDGIMAGWSENFFLASADGRFLLILEGLMQARYVYNYRERTPFAFSFNPNEDFDQHRQGFENTRTRLTFRGHVFDPSWEYLVRGEFGRNGGGFSLLDSWIRYNLSDEWGLRIGQFKLPYNREELVSPAYQLGVERSLVNEAFNFGRSQGIELAHTGQTGRLSLAVSDGPNVPNGRALNFDVEYAVTARYEHLFEGTWDQFIDFTSPVTEQAGTMLGVGVHVQDSESTGVSSPVGQQTTRLVAGTADLSLEWGGANAFGSIFYHYIDSPGGITLATGITVQAGVYVTPKWELFVRGEYAQADGQSGSLLEVADMNLVTFGTTYYFDGHDLKWTNDLSFGISDIAQQFASDLAGFRTDFDDGRPQAVFRSQFQLMF